MSVTELVRHVNALVADLVAEHGRVDLVARQVDCDAADRNALLESFEAFGVVGGAGVRVQNNGRLLLARYEGADGWVDPGDGRRPGESYRECARRGVRETTGVDPEIGDIEQVHLLYMKDSRDRDPVVNPFVTFDGRQAGGESRPGEGVAEVAWFEEPPEELLYRELGELSPSG